MASNRNPKLSMDWMYEGSSSSTNREDYLTGKKIDKALERSHGEDASSKLDVVVQNKTVATPSASGPSTLLDLETVMKEDPLVAMKVREDKKRREIFENPVKMKRLQKIVLQSMEEKMKKYMKKESRKRRSSSGSDIAEERDHRRKSRHSPDNHGRGRRKVESSRSSNRERSLSPRREDTRRTREDKPRSEAAPRRRHDSTSSSSSDGGGKSRGAGYGLVYFKKPPASAAASKDARKLSPKRDSATQLSGQQSSKQKTPWKPLSEDEMERRRREMVENAKWRDEQRKRNLKRHAKEEEHETRRETKQKGEAVDFIRSMVSSATDGGTVESRVKSKVQRLQRSDAAMNTNFARR